MRPGRQLRLRTEIGQSNPVGAGICLLVFMAEAGDGAGTGERVLEALHQPERGGQRAQVEEPCELRPLVQRGGLSLVPGHFPSQLP